MSYNLLGSFSLHLRIAALGVALLSGPISLACAQITGLYFTGASGFITNGTTQTLSSSNGYTIIDDMDYKNADGMVNFSINTAANPMLYYQLDFGTADNSLLEPGLYTDVSRYPFNYSSTGNTNGLSFFGDSREDNTLTGEFYVIEAQYSPSDVLLSFAADFIQVDGGVPTDQDYGSIRYNSDVPLDILSTVPLSLPIPEPSTWALLLGGLSVLVGFHCRRKPA